MSDLVGKILGNRYEILAEIGSGGMGHVFRAQDTFLNRRVAVKLLRTQFAGDGDFVRRFRREAQAAASLSHPNIVAIYDVGEHNGSYYIVMEHVDGETLKDKIKRDAPISVDETIRIGIQICDALEHAHQNGIVHRDIKPHNILVTRSGRVKVADFGIARAVSGTTLVHTGTIVGSAHYFSPEQARGGVVDEKSDLYSLGVVLFEMLTGRVPFDGDSPISVAVKHVQEDVPLLQTLNPAVPVSLQALVQRLLAKDTARRYPSAADVMVDLVRLREGTADNGLYPGEDFPTQVFPTPVSPQKEEPAPPKQNRPRSWLPRGVLIALVVLGVVATSAWGLYSWLNVPVTEVPDVVGEHVVNAQQILRQHGLRSESVAHEYHPEIPVNHVIRQNPPADEVVKEGRRVELVVSDGPKWVENGVPKVTGEHLQVATIKLEAAGLQVGAVEREHHAEVPVDYVISQNPRAGTSVTEGTSIDLVISKGSQPFELPNFIGENYDLVRIRLTQLGLKEGRLDRVQNDWRPGTVVNQTPAPGTPVQKGDTVNLVISGGGVARSDKIQVMVPKGGAETKLIRVVVDDANGQRVIHEADHAAGEKFELTVSWTGNQARVLVYSDGVKVGEEVLPTD
ncbi:MAG: Stk1 family PASTA domain-containing Ser/Thr kinase [Bacillota bacterium]